MPRYRKVRSVQVADLRQQAGNDVAVELPAEAEPEEDYRSLQNRAKEAGIPANQSREDLEKALSDE